MGLVLTPLATDNFTPNANPLNPAKWMVTTAPGTFPLQAIGGLCEPTVIGQEYCSENYIGVPAPDDQFVQVKVVTVPTDYTDGDFFYLAVRGDVTNTFGYYLQITAFSPGIWNLSLQSFQTSGFNVIYTDTAFIISNNDVMTLAVVGTTIYVLQNGSVIFSGPVPPPGVASGFTNIAAAVTSSTSDIQFSNFVMGSASIGADVSEGHNIDADVYEFKEGNLAKTAVLQPKLIKSLTVPRTVGGPSVLQPKITKTLVVE